MSSNKATACTLNAAPNKTYRTQLKWKEIIFIINVIGTKKNEYILLIFYHNSSILLTENLWPVDGIWEGLDSAHLYNLQTQKLFHA